jgi:NAD(P)-dependent dehydrogenase (short-subunit alcohol dehydrogenase family)
MSVRARTVLITGATRGIGLAVAERFAAAGDFVVAIGRDPEALGELEQRDRIRAERCDVTSEDAVTELFATVGPVDVLVCNAGAAEAAPLERTSLASWERLHAANATSVFLTMRAALPSMRERGDGRVVVIASTTAKVGAPYTAAYTASKHAAVGLMRAAASEVAGTPITINAICPTFVDTPMTDRSVANIVAKTGRSEGESRAALAAQSPLGRLLTPDEVAVAVQWLASPGAAAINGQAVVLDGGGIQS